MKKFLVIFLCLVLALGTIFFVGGMVLDKEYEVSKSIIIDAKTRAIHPYVNDLAKWPEWQPWKDHDPSIVVSLGKKTEGVGAAQTWTGDQGDGEVTITKSDRKTGIEYDFAWIQGGTRMPALAGMNYEEIGSSKTRVTWWMKGEMTMPIVGGWFALMADTNIGRAFDTGLAKLKTTVEAK